MKKWEDIFKDKLEGYESALPEGSLADFQARLDFTISAPGSKRFPLIWVFAVAAAAGIAALLFLRQPVVPDDAIQIICQPVQPVAEAEESHIILIPQTSAKKDIIRPGIVRNEPDTQLPEVIDTEDSTESLIDSKVEDADNQQATDITIPEVSTPFIPDMPGASTMEMKVGPSAGIVGGSGLLMVLWANRDLLVTRDYDLEIIKDRDVSVTAKHNIPVKAGISTRFPLSERLNITTGLEYSLYTSILNYSLSGRKRQKAHYLGVPLRLDWTFASNNWLDVYVGGGIEESYCLGATLNGTSIPKDGFNFTILGAGGLEWKITKNIGLYLEPEISWTPPSFTNHLQTYRTEYPIEFSITSGLRFTFGK